RAEGSLRCRRGGEGWRGSRRGCRGEGRSRHRSQRRTFRGFLPLFDAIEGDEEVVEVQVLVVAARGGRVGKERFVGRVGRRLQLLEIEAGPGEARRTSCLRVRRVRGQQAGDHLLQGGEEGLHRDRFAKVAIGSGL